MANTIKATAVAAELFQRAWNWGWVGEPAPPACPDGLDAERWQATFQQGREAVAKKRREEADGLEAFYKARAGSVTAEQRTLDRQSLECARETADTAEALAAQGRVVA